LLAIREIIPNQRVDRGRSASGSDAQIHHHCSALMVVPHLIADAGEQASWRYVEFLTATIRNLSRKLSLKSTQRSISAPMSPVKLLSTFT
jgi:hypothetical protein